MPKKETLLPYLVEKKTLRDRTVGTNSNYIAWAKNIKTARAENQPTNVYDEIKVKVATEQDIEQYG